MLNVILRKMQRNFEQREAQIFGRRSETDKGVSLSVCRIATRERKRD